MRNKDVERTISHLKIGRTTCLKLIEGLSHQQLTKIPEGFNNSIYWNIAHLVVTQQLLHYKLSDLPTYLNEDFINDFRKGSKAKANYVEEDWQNILKLFTSLPDKLLLDFEQGKFKTFTEYSTSFGVTLKTIEDALSFNNIHEGLHIGYMMALKRAISAQ